MTSLANTVLIVMLFTFGILGFLFNGTLLTFSLLKPDLRVDYCWFLIGMASVNFVYCINVGAIDTFSLLTDLDSNTTLCTVSGVILVTCGMSSCLTQSMLALNRYSSMFHRNGHSKRFSNRNIVLMLCSLYVSMFGLAMIFFVFGDYAKFENTLCCIDFTNTPLLRLILLVFAPLTTSYCITIFCGVKVALYIKKHEATVRQRELRTAIRETKQLVRLMFIEVIVPISLESPALVIIIVLKFVKVPDVLISVAVGLFVLHATTDPVVVMLVVKPYRNALRKFWNKLRNNNSVEPTIISTMIVSEHETRA